MPRPKEPILSRDLIRDQALAIIDEDGLDALTMRRLANRFNVQAASLYTHFPNKEAVLNAIAERLAKRIDPTGFADSWQAGLRTWANSYYAAIHWHPNAAPVVAAGARGGSSDVAVAGQIHAGLIGHGWPPPDAAMAATAVKFLVLGAAAATAAHLGAEGPEDAGVVRPQARLTDSSARSGPNPPADTLDRASFAFALDSLLRGLESVYETLDTRKRRPRTSPAQPPGESAAPAERPSSVTARRRQRPA